MKGLFNVFRAPAIENVSMDGGDRMDAHSQVLSQKTMLRDVFTEFHVLFDKLDRKYFDAPGLRIELGAGVAPMKSSYPDVLATDVVPGPSIDMVLDAENMNLDAASVRAIFGQNCFHHFPHPENFFRELHRVLAPGGGAILLEPYYGPLASFLYKRLFSTESFEKEHPSWDMPDATAMEGANQALSYIVFNRDRSIFENQFPDLKIVHQETCGNYMKYLLSGGLNFRQLCPDWSVPLVSLCQRMLSPANSLLALHHVIVLRKEPK